MKNREHRKGKVKGMKKVYELKNAHIELKRKEDIYKGITTDQDWFEPTLIATFDDKEEALSELSINTSYIRRGTRNLVIFEEYYVEEAIYDEEGDWIGGGDILDYSDLNE